MEYPFNLVPVVRLGMRIYTGCHWTRKDVIFVDKHKIGIIRLSSEDRMGVTISTVTGAKTHGRAIDWCLGQVVLKPAVLKFTAKMHIRN